MMDITALGPLLGEVKGLTLGPAKIPGLDLDDGASPRPVVEGPALGTLDRLGDGPGLGEEDVASLWPVRVQLDGTSLGLVRCDDRCLRPWANRR